MSELAKITAEQMDEQGVCAAPNILNGTPAQNKAIFDRMVRQLMAPAYTAMVDAVNSINTQQEEWSQAEQGRTEAETQRGENEQSRQEAEGTRETNEAARQAAEKIREQNEAARAEAEKNRKDGTTFTPAVSEEGVLSWSNTDGKPNPESRNIRGPTGAPGVVISEEEPTDPSHPAWVDPSGDEMVELLEPVAKTDAMTQPVGADGEGKLWTEPTGGGKLWRPNVTEAGVLSWEVSESETAPDARNIKGPAGSDGITPHIGGNGNWYIGDTDTGLPSRGATGAQGATGPAGADGKDGGRGPKGDPGDDYVLTAADKAEIVQATLAALPTWTGGSY